MSLINMRFVIRGSFIAVLALIAMAAGTPVNLGTPNPKPQYNLDDAPQLFEKFIKDFNRNYKDEADKRVHYEAFVKSLKTINKLNTDSNQGSAWFDINDFADYTDEQRKNMFGLAKPRSN